MTSTTTPSLVVVSLLLMFLLLPIAQGIRLEKGLISSIKQQSKNIHEDSTLVEKEAESNVACGGDKCSTSSSSSGSSRKLITALTSSTTPSKNNEKKIVGNAKATTSYKNSHKKKEEEVATSTGKQYSDLTDMTEMDYSPARRKPPIHN